MDDVTSTEIKRLDEKITLLVESLKIAGDKFETTVTARFAQVNEFRGSLDDLGKTMATRRELDDFKSLYSAAHEVLRAQVSELRSRIDVGPEGLGSLRERVDVSRGVRRGVDMSVGYVLTGMIAIAAIVTAVVTLLVK